MTLKSFNNTIVATSVVLVAIFSTLSCKNQQKEEVYPNSIASNTQDLVLAGSVDPAVPVIKTITTSLNGEGSYFPDNKVKDFDYSSYLQANNSGTSKITISGSNFGSKPGSVSINGGYSITNIVWSPTSITGRLKCEATSIARNATFTITNTDKKSMTKTADICPFLNTRRYGQCTFEGTKGRIVRNLTVPTKAYDKTANISDKYLAIAGDILHWSGHQASINSVVQDSKNKNLYTFTTTEMNGFVGNGTVLTHSFSIEFNRDKDGNILSRKSGNYFSNLYKKTAAASYYR